MAFIQWGKLSNEELVIYAKENFSNLTREQLKKSCKGLANALYERNLMDKVATTKGQRWKKMSDEEMVNHFRENYPEVKSRSELRQLNKKLYEKLLERGLLKDLLGDPVHRSPRDLNGMTNDELIDLTKQYGEVSRTGLQFEDPMLYRVILGRGLIEEVTVKKSKPRGEYGDWKSMTDDELISYTINSFPNLKNRQQLRKFDLGLANTINRRELWEKLGFKKVEKVYWHKMSDDELLEHFKNEYEGLSRRELEVTDRRVYQALRKRNLIEKAIPETKNKQFPRYFFKKMTDAELVDYYKQNYSHVKTRTQLAKECQLLKENLQQRNLLDSVGLESKLDNPRNLKDQKDEELVKYFRTNYENITTRTQLARKDWVLYRLLRKRNLLNACFEQNESDSIDGLLESYVNGSDEL